MYFNLIFTLFFSSSLFFFYKLGIYNGSKRSDALINSIVDQEFDRLIKKHEDTIDSRLKNKTE
jgi:hypothetical protein